ncbi:MAG: SdpI family protein [Tissierellia bacterium]|nr:SdpI family protein [Tissierellia bacterium]
MNVFFIIIDYLIPILLLISPPYWKKMSQGNINQFSGLRTRKSMMNRENWKKANSLAGKYSLYLGVFLFIFTTIMRWLKLLPMEWNSLLLAFIDILCFIILAIYIDRRL